MKVIDLLNKISNGEHPKKFKLYNMCIEDFIYELNDNGCYYEISSKEEFTKSINLIFCLNDEVEIIEDTPKEDKKIENLKSEDFNGVIDNDTRNIIIKINEIIDKVNGEDHE